MRSCCLDICSATEPVCPQSLQPPTGAGIVPATDRRKIIDMRTFRDRVRHALLFEAVALAIFIPGSAALFDQPLDHMGVIGIASATLATLWNFVFNVGFDRAMLRLRGSSEKTMALRVAHTLLFEAGLVVMLIPLIVMFGSEAVLYPGTAPIGEMFANGGVSAIWGSYIRYIGAGALATGGIISLIKSLPMIVTTFRDSMKALAGGQGESELRTDKNISMKVVVICLAVLIVLTGVLPQIPVGIGGAALIAIFGFFFAAVSSRMVGIVGSSNNPVSGMAIATLLFSTIILKATGAEGAAGMKAAIAIGTVICIVAAIAGDTSQDLKTGYLVGATPIKQQYGEIIGTIVSAIAIGGVLYLLDAAWGFGSEQLGAPQATLMKMIVEGVMGGKLPWGLVIVGVVLACVVEILGIPVLPFAIGVYLPVQLNACIMIGGLVRLYFDRKKYASEQEQTRVTNRGVLYCSGMIAGEGLVGIVLAILAVIGVSDKINMAGVLNLSAGAGNIASTVVFAVMILLVFKFTLGGRKNA